MSQSILPSILEKRAKAWLKFRLADHIAFEEGDRAVNSLEHLLRQYHLNFPFFIKIDAWKAFYESPDEDLWILERIGWGRWKKEFQLLYVTEGLSIPRLEDAEVISVNSSSPPFLMGACEMEWGEQMAPEQVQTCRLDELPQAMKDKAYPYLEELAMSLSETLEQMTAHESEFSEFLNQKVQEYLDKLGERPPEIKSKAITKYFRNDRRFELFQEFMQDHESD